MNYGLPLLIAAGAAYLARRPIMSTLRSLSPQGISILKNHEGFRAYTYLDGAGHPTIGFGHKLTQGEAYPNGVTIHQAEQLLFQDTMKAQSAVRENVKVTLTQPQFDALVSLIYNIGVSAFKNSTLLRVLNQGYYAAAAEQFLAWKYAGGQPILLGRRQKEKALFETPERVA